MRPANLGPCRRRGPTDSQFQKRAHGNAIVPPRRPSLVNGDSKGQDGDDRGADSNDDARVHQSVSSSIGGAAGGSRHSPPCPGPPSAVSGAVAPARRKAAASTTAATQRLCRTPTRSPRKPTAGGPARKAT